MTVQINEVPLRIKGSIGGYNNPNKIIIHHPMYNGSIQALNEMMISMGYSMVGYNFYVRKDGSIWKGRPTNVQGANCYGQNTQSIGVCCEGNFDNETMGQAQFDATVELCKYLKQTYGINEVGPHSKYYNTTCPGANFPINAMLSAINDGSSYVAPAVENKTSNNDALSIAKEYAGAETVQIQERLKALGYNIGSSGVDGIFGQATFEAVKKFQSDNGLTADGIPGNLTKAALLMKGTCTHAKVTVDEIKGLQSALNGFFNVNLAVDGIIGSNTNAYIDKLVVSDGNYHEITKWVQRRLVILGYSVGSYGADGYYGEATKNALIDFQNDHGISADGIIGPNTIRKLLHTGANSTGSGNKSASSVEIRALQNAMQEYGANLNYGADGIAGQETMNALAKFVVGVADSREGLVKWIQDRLSSLGYSLGSYGIDGAFGTGTKSAVESFQSNYGLTADGIVGINTWTKLIKG